MVPTASSSSAVTVDVTVSSKAEAAADSGASSSPVPSLSANAEVPDEPGGPIGLVVTGALVLLMAGIGTWQYRRRT